MRNDPQPLGARGRSPVDIGPLRIVTGRLFRSLQGSRSGASMKGESVRRFTWEGNSGRIQYGSAVPYAAVHEYGSKGEPMSVKAHSRTITQAFGRALRAPVEVQVKAHMRKGNIRARPYLSPALADNEVFIRERIEIAVVEALS